MYVSVLSILERCATRCCRAGMLASESGSSSNSPKQEEERRPGNEQMLLIKTRFAAVRRSVDQPTSWHGKQRKAGRSAA